MTGFLHSKNEGENWIARSGRAMTLKRKPQTMFQAISRRLLDELLLCGIEGKPYQVLLGVTGSD
jgi:hypothetical protein